jgi:hypothetical protein
MVYRSILVASVLLALIGCKTSSNEGLASAAASSAVEQAYFASPAAIQTASFSEGKAQPAKPLALDTFLYEKRWLECKNTEPGPIERETLCTFDSAGRTYAHENAWTAAAAANGCAECETWTVPLATARFLNVTAITRIDPTHASVAYTYSVVPNEFGGELGAWMADHPKAWCGPDPRVAGGWSQTRTGVATFEQRAGTWHLETPATSFSETFAVQAAGASAEHPCPA